MIERKVCYFEEKGKANTEATLKLAVETANAMGIKNIVLATTGGDTAKMMADCIEHEGIAITAVTHAFGQSEPNTNPMSAQLRRYLAEKGFNIESFGEGSVIVRSVPATLHNLKGLASLLEDFANALFNGNHLSFSERCDRALYTVACKAALKAGVKNRPEDDENVVKMLSENPSLRYCPHGRPFIKTIPKREVEKYFDR